MAIFLIIALTLMLPISSVYSEPETEECYPKNPCSCIFNNNKKIDIENLLQKDFLEDEQNNGFYFFHGCTNGNLTLSNYIPKINSSEIREGSLIWYQPILLNNSYIVNKTNFVVLGHAENIVYTSVKNNDETFYELLYKNKENITASVRLVCNNYQVPYLKVINGPKEFTLNSPHACLIEIDQGLSTGSIFLLLLFFGFLFYFIIGGALLYFLRGASGLELIPNIDFWRELPGLVKDGTLFVFSGCNINYVSNDVYDKI